MATSLTSRSNPSRPQPVGIGKRLGNRVGNRIGISIAVSLGLAALSLSACTNDTRDAATTTTPVEPVDTAPIAGAAPAADASGDAAADATAAAGSLVAVLTADGRYNTLVSALIASGVDSKLGQKGPFTVFAPTDQAFQKLPSNILARLLLPENAKTLARVMTYHVIGGLIPTASINEGDKETLEGKKVHFSFVDGAVTVNGSPFVGELGATNGIVHGIDFVLVPPEVDLNSLGGTVDTAAPAPAAAIGIPVLQTLAEQGTFATLLKYINKAGLTEQLGGPGPFTVFAPTDDAFKRLPGDAVARLLLPQNQEALVTLLKHHVIAKQVNGRDLKDKSDLTMLDGSTLKIGIVQGKISVGDATMTFADQDATNGVVHTIDTVLVPSSVDLNALKG